MPDDQTPATGLRAVGGGAAEYGPHAARLAEAREAVRAAQAVVDEERAWFAGRLVIGERLSLAGLSIAAWPYHDHDGPRLSADLVSRAVREAGGYTAGSMAAVVAAHAECWGLHSARKDFRATGLRTLGLDPEDYRSVRPGPGRIEVR